MGGGGVINCSKLRDVIYGRPLKYFLTLFQADRQRSGCGLDCPRGQHRDVALHLDQRGGVIIELLYCQLFLQSFQTLMKSLY